MPTSELRLGDCRVVMAEMAPNSVDAIVTDPPYGLEFMGKDWDRLDGGLPQENVWKGRRGNGGSAVGGDDSKPSSRHHVSYGGKRPAFKRCTVCGKREFSGSPCRCAVPEWVIEYPDGAPSGMIRQQRWHESWAREAYRVLKPGGHLLAFGGTRTFHRLACALEDAGFEIRDTLSWLYGSGLPKSLDVSKQLDKVAGAEREVVGMRPIAYPDSDCWGTPNRNVPPPAHTPVYDGDWKPNVTNGERPLTAPATDLAAQWAGWGTALKPAWEPIILARKPLGGTVAANVAAHGTGGLNIDATRIPTDDRWKASGKQSAPSVALCGGADGSLNVSVSETHPSGRWPANVLLGCCGHDPHDPECAVRLLDEQSGKSRSRVGKPRQSAQPGNGYGMTHTGAEYNDTGGASRFFYVAKASRAERNAGLDGMPERAVFQKNTSRMIRRSNPDTGEEESFEFNPHPAANHHPTVKPIALMRWLMRLVTPPNGTILDPFTGSGTTGCAAALEGFAFIGIEQDADYLAIAERRIAHWTAHACCRTQQLELAAD